MASLQNNYLLELAWRAAVANGPMSMFCSQLVKTYFTLLNDVAEVRFSNPHNLIPHLRISIRQWVEEVEVVAGTLRGSLCRFEPPVLPQINVLMRFVSHNTSWCSEGTTEYMQYSDRWDDSSPKVRPSHTDRPLVAGCSIKPPLPSC